MGLVFTITNRQSSGSETKVEGTVAFDSSYPTNGESYLPASLALFNINRLILQDESGYSFSTDYTNKKIKVFQGASGNTGATSGGTPAGTVAAPTITMGAYTPTGTVAAPTFTGTSPTSNLDLATPAFSGTGLTAAGQVMTTGSTHTMTLNQCAGMWLIPATGATAPMLILSNTAVSGAAAVLTVQGTAGNDAGAYKIVKSLTPIGTNSAPAFTGGAASLTGTNSAPVFTGAALSTHTHSVGASAGGEVPNGTNLSALTAIEFEAYGY